MSRYIDVDAFRDFEISRCGRMPIIGTDSSNNVPLGPELFRFPAADVVEVRHGTWLPINSKTAKCSNCNTPCSTHGSDFTGNALIHKALYNYCPSCGAKMDERKEE